MKLTKNNRTIENALVEAIQSLGDGVTREGANEKAQELQAQATSEVGAGVYVTALLDYDNDGVLMTYKRPGLRQRIEVFGSASLATVEEKNRDEEPEEGVDVEREALKAELLAITEDFSEDQFNDQGYPIFEEVTAETSMEFTEDLVKSLWDEITEGEQD